MEFNVEVLGNSSGTIGIGVDGMIVDTKGCISRSFDLESLSILFKF